MAEIRNPNQPGGQSSGGNTNFILYMVVMLGVLLGVQYYRAKHTAPLANNTAQSTQANAPQAASPSTAQPQNASAANGDAAGKNSSAVSPATPAVVATNESTTVIDSELYRIEFTNKGAEVKSWVLKKHKARDGKPLDLVNHGVAREFGAPMELWTYDPALTQQLRSAMYVPSATGVVAAPQTVTFRYSANGLDVTKTFSFDTSYVVKADVMAKRNGVPVRALLAWPSAFGDMDEQASYNSSTIESSANNHETHIAFSKVGGGNTINGPFEYTGVAGQFFTAIFIPENPQTATAITLHGTADLDKLKAKPEGKSINVPILGAGVGDVSGHSVMSVFVGPKSYELMKSIKVPSGGDLSPVVDFGFFGPIGKGLFFALHFLQAHGVANWGWAIVVFTVLINLILLPIRVKQMKSSMKMMRLQPQMDAIKAKYAKYKVTDPKRADMNAEIMALQKENGVNMFAGCIPTLLTMPLLWAMFTMLGRIVELRDAHWFWLHSLTAADPYHILPIVMVVSQFLVQFYMPSPGVDPQQQKMMAFTMPAFLGYISWNYASGLSLYMFAGNVIMVIQQYVMNQSSVGKEMRVIADKRKKKQGAKVIQGRR